MGTFNVYTNNNATGSPQRGKLLFTMAGNHGNKWYQVFATLPQGKPINVWKIYRKIYILKLFSS